MIVARDAFGLLLATALLLLASGPSWGEDPPPPVDVRVMTWNIWKGGREDGAEVGPQRVVEVIRSSGADIVAMQETYGSGERIAEALGFHLLARGTNVAILSRHRIVEDLSVFEEFKCVGGLVALPDGRRIAVYSVWLPYEADIWLPEARDPDDVPAMLAACAPSARDLAAIRDAIAERLAGPQYEGVPLVIAGDFNAMSHLDYSEVARSQYGAVVEWPTSRVLTDAGFRDSYRERNPIVDRRRDRTWSPRFPDQEQDRIDFIHDRGDALETLASRTIDEHPILFPSDHAAVLTTFRLARPPERQSLRVVTYNIRHGRGMDDRVDLARTAEVLRALTPDLVGLQEVDVDVARSGGVNQAAELGRMLTMHPAFGAFMPLQGGRYGMAILSRHPIQRVHSIPLPRGNEPRVALAVEVRLPDGQSIIAVNVHFDWVDDDAYRFAQAEALARWIDEQTLPCLVIGDFNDGPGSRTLELFRRRSVEAVKPAGARFTFPANEPNIEIDHLFALPPARWKANDGTVIAEESASDHRPVVAEWHLQVLPTPPAIP